MTVINVQSQLTLIELAKRTNDKNLLTIAEVLTQDHPILADAVWLESNQPTSHVGTKRTNLPTGTWRRLNKGVATEASATTQVTEPMGMLESYSKVDAKLVSLAPNKAEFRSQEDLAFVEGLSQTIETAIIYSDFATTPEKFDGFTPRYNSLALANVADNGGSGADCQSLWIIQWGATKVHLIYPPGGSVGIKVQDLGELTVYDDETIPAPYQAFMTHFTMDCGLYVHDDRCVQRIANIETTGASNLLDDDLIIASLNLMPQRGGGPGTAMYASRILLTQFDIMAKDKTNVNYTSDTAFGEMVTRFRGVPIRLCEAIVDETAIA